MTLQLFSFISRTNSGADINICSDPLPNSTERELKIVGKRDQITKCIYAVCVILLENPPKGCNCFSCILFLYASMEDFSDTLIVYPIFCKTYVFARLPNSLLDTHMYIVLKYQCKFCLYVVFYFDKPSHILKQFADF